ncbi:MAG TPA: hypothetical protein VJU60_10280 [Thermoleophilaceae bacterium]|nr:hypothetical protein [Thermoleophilaceae bacterium]
MKWVGWILAFTVGMPVIGIGIPVGWVWIASQFQHGGSAAVGLAPVLILSFGILWSYIAVSTVANWIAPPPPDKYRKQPRSRWLEPMAPDRARRTTTTSVETFFIVTTMVVSVSADIFLVFFGHPGVPAAP